MFAIFARSPKSDTLYDYDTLYKARMNWMKVVRGAEP